MLRLSINDDDFDAVITENDRGDWVIRDTPGIPLVVVEGFGGENIIVVSFVPRQSFRTSVSVQFISVDSPIETKTKDISGFAVSGTVNALIREWYKEHQVIETEEALQEHIAQQRKELGLDNA